MKFSIANDVFDLTPSTLAELEDCSEESVIAPGYIQPQGMLFLLQVPDLTILQVSENVEQMLGLPVEAVLGQPLKQLMSEAQAEDMDTILRSSDLESYNPFEVTLTVKALLPYPTQASIPSTFRSLLHPVPQGVILELVPLVASQTSSLQLYNRLQTAILNLRRATDLINLAQALAHEVKSMTGFDRVMVYRFEADEHGVVIAEAKEPQLESYLGLHYPSIDIPTPARRLFLRNWVRQIPDINATPAQLISFQPSPEHAPLDLSQCVLRGVSPYHVEYLQNMGVKGTLTISLIDDHRLWGLIACHHYSPRSIHYEMCKTCEFLGQFASIELVQQQDRDLAHYRAQVNAIQDELQRAFLREPNFIQQVLIQHAAQLLLLVDAEGAAIALDHHISLIGRTPSLEQVQTLLAWLPQNTQNDIYYTNCLARAYPPALAFKDCASGILAISIVLHQKSYHIVWFRPEQIQTVNWAGNPLSAVAIAPSGEPYLTPRQSFALWQETVQQTSQPWTPSRIEAALMLRSTLMLAVLEFSQTALEQAAERAAIASRAKSQFLAKMSHELRTPLNAILGFTQIMNHSPDIPEEFQDYLEIINRSGEHLLGLINDVLEVSKIEAGQLVLTKSCFDIYRFIRSIEEMFALKASGKGLFLTIQQDASVPRYVCGDEAKLRQILINLLSNAIKFTQEGGVTLRLLCDRLPSTETEISNPNSMLLRLEVEDTGCGVATSDRESIFEAFVQTDQGRHVQGTGLGLSISRQFARLMGGDITLQSIVNRGSTFICQVQLSLPSALEIIEPEATRQVVGLEPGQPSYRILVAENVPENRQLLMTLLTSVGFEVSEVENGTAAIAQWQVWQPHLIFMDIQMPEMDGYEATQQIRQQECIQQQHGVDVQPTPIIALTAYAFEDDRIASLDAGCTEHIAKPFTEVAIFEAIARHLGVRYCYREDSLLAASTQKPLTAHDLAVMPTAWINHVHEAALDLNDEKLHRLITQIPETEPLLIATLTTLVNNFQLEAIATLTQG